MPLGLAYMKRYIFARGVDIPSIGYETKTVQQLGRKPTFSVILLQGALRVIITLKAPCNISVLGLYFWSESR